MATRSSIKIEGINFAKVYKHYDGSPKVMLPWLTAFNQDFEANRGDDPEYKFAQLLRHSIEATGDDSKHLGWGVYAKDEPLDVAYAYTLHRDGSVTYK